MITKRARGLSVIQTSQWTNCNKGELGGQLVTTTSGGETTLATSKPSCFPSARFCYNLSPNSLLLQFVPWLVWITIRPRARFVIILSPRSLLLPFVPSLVFAAVCRGFAGEFNLLTTTR